MTALTASARGRAKAEEIMTDTCTITRITGRAYNPGTGLNTPTTTTPYSGKCRARAPRSTVAQDLDAGEAALPKAPLVVSIPITVTAVAEGDRVSVTASNDPEMVGKTLLVKSIQSGTHITARRLLCEELPDA